MAAGDPPALFSNTATPVLHAVTRAGSPVANILGKISLASLPVTSPLPIIATSSARFAALTGDSDTARPASLSAAVQSPITQFAAAFGSPEADATAS